jgi:uncharacterized protein (DUF58 family)
MATRDATERGEEPARKQELDPQVLSEIGNLALRARTVADSALAGMHRSRHHGTSVEFAEHKEYSPGDNVRHLDWRAFARFDRDYIKRFEDEANLRALLVVDSSGSMGYPAAKSPRGGSGAQARLTKLEYATTCAGALAYVLARQGDAVGLATFTDRLDIKVPSKARRGHLQEILTNLEALTPEGKSGLAGTLERLSEGLTRRAIVVIFSDLLDGGLAALPGMARLRARKHDVVLFHTLDPDEFDFPFEDSTEFLSMEDERRVQIDARAIRDAYQKELARFLAEAETQARAARVEYTLARTDQPPGQLVARFLARRLNARTQAR